MWRIVTFFGMMGLFAITFYAGTMHEHTPEQAQALVDEFMEIIDGIDGAGIFFHNTTLALPMFVPGFGVALSLFSAWSTGFTFAALATLNPLLIDIQPLSILFLTPFGIMELTAYSIASSRSLLLTIMIIRREGIKKDLRNILIEVGMVAGLLLGGGLIEHQMIEMVRDAGVMLPGF